MRAEVALERTALRVLDLLLETPPPDRLARAVELCSDEPRTLARVQELLARTDEPDLDVAELSAEVARLVESFAPSGPGVASGTRLGGFEIVRFLGRGGMGEVYEAMQPEPRRRVALKVMRGGELSGELRQRFVNEARMLARLRHPAIAQVFSAGTHVETTPLGEREVPYLAMEFVEGARDVVTFAREESLDLDARVRLAARFARAVQHGHERGVVHRDLKPANLLVGSDGEPKVIDFGIARAVGDEPMGATRATRQGDLLGTLGYIAPEVLRGEVDSPDTQADVYALGVVLYELALAKAPIDLTGCGVAEAARRVAERAPLRPRAIDPALDRDLEAVLLRAVAPEPEQRYAFAALFADDLERWLEREPVLARAPSRLHRLALFARRNRLLTASIVALFVVLCAAAAGGTKLAWDRGLALEEALATRDDFLGLHAVVIGELFTELEGVGSTPSRIKLVSAASEKLARVGERASTDPEVLRALAETQVRLGDVLGGAESFHVGDVDGAARHYELSATFLRRLRELGEQGEDLDALEAKLLARGVPTDAALSSEDPGAMQERALELLEPIAERRPDDVRTQLLLVDALQSTLVSHGNYSVARQRHDRGIEILRRLHVEHPGAAEVASALSVGLTMRSSIDFVLGERERAVTDVGEAVALLEPVVAADPGQRTFAFNLGYARRFLAHYLNGTKRHAEAEGHASRALDVLEPILLEDPTNARVRLELMQARRLRARSRLELALASQDAARADELFAGARSDLELCMDELAELDSVMPDDYALPTVRRDVESHLERLDALGR